MNAILTKVITLTPSEARDGADLRLNNEVEKACPVCRGAGKRLIRLSNTMRDAVECENCEGYGVTKVSEIIELKVEPFDENQLIRRLVYEGLGNYSVITRSRGDLIIEIITEKEFNDDENYDSADLFNSNEDDFEDQSFPTESDQADEPLLCGFSQQLSRFDDFSDGEYYSDSEGIENQNIEIYEPLMELASPEFYDNNAFRVLGILPGISEREAKRTVDKLQKLRRVGDSGVNTKTLMPLSYVSDEAIEQAAQTIFDAEKRFLHEFFWIYPADIIGETENIFVISALNQSNISSAIHYLREEILDVSFANPALPQVYCEHDDPFGRKLHNMAVLSHIQALDDSANWKDCYWWWEKLYKNDSFWNFLEEKRVPEINNPLVRNATVRHIRNSLPRFLLTINARLAVRFAENAKEKMAEEQTKLVSENFAGQNLGLEILHNAVQPKKEELEHHIEQFDVEIKNTDENKVILIRKFLDKSARILRVLTILLGSHDDSDINWGTKVVRSARNAAVDYGNESEDWKECLKIGSILLSLPCSTKIREQLKKDQEELTSRFISDELETLCDAAVEACEKDILLTPTIVQNFLTGSRNLIDSLEINKSLMISWAEPIIHLVRNLLIKYSNETGNIQDCLDLQQALSELPCSADLRTQLAEDKENLSKQLHQKEITDLLDEALTSKKNGFPPVPVIAKNLLMKCRKVIDKKSRQLGRDNETVQELNSIIYEVVNSLLIEHVNEKEDFSKTLEVLRLLKPFALTAEHKKQLSRNISALEDNSRYFVRTVLCWFCQEEKGTSVSSINVRMYGEVERSQFFNQRQVKWKNLDVTVPRCVGCDAIHARQSKLLTRGVLIGLGSGILLNIPLFILFGSFISGNSIWLTGIIVAGFIWLGYDIANQYINFTQTKQIKGLKAKYQHPQIIELENRGWTVGDRPSA